MSAGDLFALTNKTQARLDKSGLWMWLETAEPDAGSDVTIDNVLQHFLPTAAVGGSITFFQHVGFQLGEAY